MKYNPFRQGSNICTQEVENRERNTLATKLVNETFVGYPATQLCTILYPAED